MKLDAATLAITLTLIALGGVVWGISLNLQQAAQIRRLEIAMRAMCPAQAQRHHEQACAEMSLPLQYPPSPFTALIPDNVR